MPNLIMNDPADRLELAYLHPDGDAGQIKNLAETAQEIVSGVSCRAAVVHAADLWRLMPLLEGTAVRPAVVIDFPDGLGGFRAKKDQARFAMQCGVKEADVVVNLRQVLARDKHTVIAECRAVREYIPDVKLIAQIPYLWKENPHSVFWLIDLLPQAGVYCLKDWTGKRNFSSAANVGYSIEERLYYTRFIASYLEGKTRAGGTLAVDGKPILLKIAGEVDAKNAPLFIRAGADFLGVSYDKARAVREALVLL